MYPRDIDQFMTFVEGRKGSTISFGTEAEKEKLIEAFMVDRERKNTKKYVAQYMEQFRNEKAGIAPKHELDDLL